MSVDGSAVYHMTQGNRVLGLQAVIVLTVNVAEEPFATNIETHVL